MCLQSSSRISSGNKRDEDAVAETDAADMFEPLVRVVADSAVWMVKAGQATKLHNGGADSLAMAGNTTYELKGRRITVNDLSAAKTIAEHFDLPDQNNIIKSRSIIGLAVLPIEEKDNAISVLTDQGMSLYKDAWLYDKLLRPIEGDIDNSSNVLIVPHWGADLSPLFLFDPLKRGEAGVCRSAIHVRLFPACTSSTS